MRLGACRISVDLCLSWMLLIVYLRPSCLVPCSSLRPARLLPLCWVASNTLVLLQTVTLQQGRSTLCFATHPAFNLLRLPSHSLYLVPSLRAGKALRRYRWHLLRSTRIGSTTHLFRLLALSSASDHLPNNLLNLMPCLLRTLPRAPQAAGLCSLSQPYARSSVATF